MSVAQVKMVCSECHGTGRVIHPAWLAVFERHVDPMQLHDWQIALTMTVAGFGDDVIVTKRSADGQPLSYGFPEPQILCCCQEMEPSEVFGAASFEEYPRGVAAGVLRNGSEAALQCNRNLARLFGARASQNGVRA